ncbi:WXG100 family type VII secretion target [Rhodococcus gannanensis]|jgi:WXG100 family type VII secretion target|uniref:ESAT-6-like protein n=1 Tax=Rhodococcus gannanensis TaxID=1960308 RepID=A0ABW4P8D8_9NOCA
MSGQMRTTTETMETAATHVSDVNGDIQGLLSSLQGRLSAVNGAWEGAAKVAFDNLMQRWDQEAKNLNQALLEISENIRANGAAFASAQDEHVAAINNSAGSLNL